MLSFEEMKKALKAKQESTTLKGYFTAFPSDEAITFSAKMILVDGKISFDIDFDDILEKIISAKGWKSCHGFYDGWYFQIQDNNLVKISYKEDRKGRKYEDTLVSSNEAEVALFKIVMKLLYGRE